MSGGTAFRFLPTEVPLPSLHFFSVMKFSTVHISTSKLFFTANAGHLIMLLWLGTVRLQLWRKLLKKLLAQLQPAASLKDLRYSSRTPCLHPWTNVPGKCIEGHALMSFMVIVVHV
jgi:hypothetical protein